MLSPGFSPIHKRRRPVQSPGSPESPDVCDEMDHLEFEVETVIGLRSGKDRQGVELPFGLAAEGASHDKHSRNACLETLMKARDSGRDSKGSEIKVQNCIRNESVQCLVCWKGFENDKNTWEPIENYFGNCCLHAYLRTEIYEGNNLEWILPKEYDCDGLCGVSATNCGSLMSSWRNDDDEFELGQGDENKNRNSAVIVHVLTRCFFD